MVFASWPGLSEELGPPSRYKLLVMWADGPVIPPLPEGQPGESLVFPAQEEPQVLQL